MIALMLAVFLKMNLSYSFVISEVWNSENSPMMNSTCSTNERFCKELCNQEGECSFNVKVCKDCVGTSILMTNIFEQMGTQYRNTGSQVSEYELIDFIKEQNFVIFSSRSIYNQIDSFDGPVIRARFQSLCSSGIEYPVVFFQLKEKSSVINEIKYVVCGSDIYSMSASPDIIVNKKLNFYYLDNIQLRK